MLKNLNWWQKILAFVAIAIGLSIVLVLLFTAFDPFLFGWFNEFPKGFGIMAGLILWIFSYLISRLIVFLSFNKGVDNFRQEFIFFSMSFLVPLIVPPALVSMSGQISNFVANSTPEVIIFDLASHFAIPNPAWVIKITVAIIVAIYIVWFRKKEVLDGL